MISCDRKEYNMSGHSKWATTKRHKAVIDAKRSSLFTKLARNITVAAKTGKNLDLAIELAKKASMPKDNIQRAIDKGTGKIASDEIVNFNYEAYGPGGIGVIINILTDKKSRALSEIKAALNKHNGRIATSGAVSYLFEEQGVITLNKSGQTLPADEIEMLIIDSGAKDYEIEDNTVYVYTNPKELAQIKQKIEFKALHINDAKLEYSPKNYVNIDEAKKEQVIALLSALEDLDDVNEIFTNADL